MGIFSGHPPEFILAEAGAGVTVVIKAQIPRSLVRGSSFVEARYFSLVEMQDLPPITSYLSLHSESKDSSKEFS